MREAGGWVWRTRKYPPTDESTGTLRLVRAALKAICGEGTAGADGRAVQAPGAHSRAREGRAGSNVHTAGSKCGKQGLGVAHTLKLPVTFRRFRSSTAPPMSICACGRRGRGESETARLRGATRSASRELTVRSPLMTVHS
eukprot:scaffold1423_cov130-Isochrysis_galbana.AAC.3